MSVIRCETCNGTGKVKQTVYKLDPIGKMLKQPEGYIGFTVDRMRELEQHTYSEEISVTCFDCGGSGCKWQEDKENE